MKKVFSIFTMAFMLLASTGCSSDGNEDSQVFSFTTQMLNKAIAISDPSDMHVSTTTASIKWTYNNDSHITLTAPVAINGTTVANVAVNDEMMEYDSTRGMMVFTAASAGTGVTNLTGYYNPGDYTVYLEFTYNNTHKVTCVSQLKFPYTSSSITNTQQGGDPFESDNMPVSIVVNPTDMKAQMRIYNLRLATSESSIQYVTFLEGLTVTITGDGYTISGTNVKADDVSNYTLNEFNATVTNNGLNIEGTFTLNEIYQGTFSGKMFGVVQVQP